MTTSHVTGNVCIYLCIYLAACSVCRLNVPENTPIQSITRSARAHWQLTPILDFKNRLQKLGQLLAQGFCCVDRVGVQTRATACSPVRRWRSEGDNMHGTSVTSHEMLPRWWSAMRKPTLALCCHQETRSTSLGNSCNTSLKVKACLLRWQRHWRSAMPWESTEGDDDTSSDESLRVYAVSSS